MRHALQGVQKKGSVGVGRVHEAGSDASHGLQVLCMPVQPMPYKHAEMHQAFGSATVAFTTFRHMCAAADCMLMSPHRTRPRCMDAALEEGLPLDTELSSGAHRCEVAVSRPGNGCWLCAYTPPAPGFYRLQLSSRGAPIGSSPFSVQVHLGPCNALSMPG